MWELGRIRPPRSVLFFAPPADGGPAKPFCGVPPTAPGGRPCGGWAYTPVVKRIEAATINDFTSPLLAGTIHHYRVPARVISLQRKYPFVSTCTLGLVLFAASPALREIAPVEFGQGF